MRRSPLSHAGRSTSAGAARNWSTRCGPSTSRGGGRPRWTARRRPAVLPRLTGWGRGRGWEVAGVTPSPLPGPKGNLEFFVRVVKDRGRSAEEVDELVDTAVDAAHASVRKGRRR